MKKSKFGFGLLLASAVLTLSPQPFLRAVPYAYAQEANGQSDNNIHAAVLNALKKSDFKDVQVQVNHGVVDLEGMVKDFATKEDLDKRVHRLKNVVAVRNKVQVMGAGRISDSEIQKQLVNKLQYDRVGYGNAFNAIGVSVQNGVVVLGGHALGPVAADSAVDLASRTAGVQDVVNNIQVDPLSPNDNRIRLQTYRAVYGFPSLNKYAINPAQPIRITVVGGHIILDGVVDNQADKDTAGIRAKSVPGAFSVTNNLRVATQQKKEQ